MLGVAPDEREGEAEFVLEGACRRELDGGIVDPDRAGSEAGEPR